MLKGEPIAFVLPGGLKYFKDMDKSELIRVVNYCINDTQKVKEESNEWRTKYFELLKNPKRLSFFGWLINN